MTRMGGEPCVRSARAEGSASAALATVANFHQLPIGARELAPLVGLPQVTELGELVVAARLLGFESVPLEGGYDELPEVPRPNIVRFKDRFVVLYEIDADATRVADPLHGVRTLSRAEFSSEWTGDCLQVVPADLDSARRKLVAHRAWWRRLLVPRALAFAVGAAALGGLAAGDGLSARSLALAVAAAGSLWLVLFQADCAQCSRAHQLAGALPLDRLGALFYPALLVAVRLDALHVGYALAFAAGGHVALVAILARERVLCLPCVVTAAAAWLAFGLSARALLPLIAVVVAAAGVAAAALSVPFFRRVAEARALFEARRLALEWLAHAGASDKVRVVVWKRAGCASCLFYESVWKPALAQDYQEAIAIEERDAAGLHIATPLILVAGSVRVLFVALTGREDDYQRLQNAVEAARAPSPLGALDGMTIV
jgi:hypothetical protein